jgi:hypothetical protein
MMCNKLRWAVLAAGLVSFGVLASSALAVPTAFFDRDNSTTFMTSFPNSLAKFNQFTASLSSFGIDNVESASGVNPTLVFGATGIQATTQGVLAQNAPGFQIGTQALLEAEGAGFPQVNTAFSFNTAITSFGLYVIQGGDGANNNPTTFRLKNTVTNAFVDVPVQVGPGWGTDNAFFFGVTDATPFNQVEIIEAADAADGMLYDNVVAGGAVPEPCSIGLVMLSGFWTLGRGARARRG